MLSKENLLECISLCKEKGFDDVKMRDVCYCLLLHEMDDYDIAYKSLFGTNNTKEEIESYNNSDKIKQLKIIINKKTAATHTTETREYEEITFDENKEAMVKMLNKLDSDVASGIVDAEKAYSIETNIRKALVSTFATSKRLDEEVIKVETKYNDICPYCHREVRAKPISKDEAIKMYKLIES